MLIQIRGFTLIELMIVVAVIGVLAIIAFPAYEQYGTKARRADAKISLTELAQRQESYYADNNGYADTFPKLGLNGTNYGFKKTGDNLFSKDENYILSIFNSTQKSFKLQATPTAGQTDDKTCALFSIDSTGKREAKDKSNNDTSKECWK
jgi:type IV pilus assembly protein PilE